MLGYLQMRSQIAIAVLASWAAASAVGCGEPNVSVDAPVSLPVDAPDLALRGVAFARLADGRVVARGTAERLDYTRAGGRLVASLAAASIVPDPGSQLSSLGTLRCRAPAVQGTLTNRQGHASGGVNVEAQRGDRGFTEAADYDRDLVRSSHPVRADGPGYQVRSHGLVARTDGSDLRLDHGVSGTLELEAAR